MPQETKAAKVVKDDEAPIEVIIFPIKKSVFHDKEVGENKTIIHVVNLGHKEVQLRCKDDTWADLPDEFNVRLGTRAYEAAKGTFYEIALFPQAKKIEY